MATKAKTRAMFNESDGAYQRRSKCRVGKPHERMNCCDKIGFQTWMDAKHSLNEYLREHLYSNMAVYKCPQHSCFHLGHDKYMNKEEICERTSEMPGRVFADEENRRGSNADIMTETLWKLIEQELIKAGVNSDEPGMRAHHSDQGVRETGGR
jgi:hypothetical protein